MMKMLKYSLRCWNLAVIAAAIFVVLPGAVSGQEVIRIPESLLKIIRSVEVPAETDGVISSMDVVPGNIVSAGQMFAQIKEDAARLALQAAEFEYKVAQAKVENNIDIRFSRKAYEVAKADLQRALDANRRVNNTITEGDIDHRRLVVDRTQLEIEQAEHNDRIENLNLSLTQNLVMQQQLLLDRHAVRAPIDGMVVAVHRVEGEWARTSDPLIRIVRIDRLRVEDFVPVQVAIQGIDAKSVIFEPSIPELQHRKFHGKVVFVHPEANTLNSKVRIWAEIENTDLLLRPGLKGVLTILHDTEKLPAEPAR